MAQILGGAALLLGLLFTALTLRTGQETLRVNQEGQITDRFTKAIEQLGSKELQVRLGGIYALERIARDSKRDHGPIMEVLTAYVRENAPLAPDFRPPHIRYREANPNFHPNIANETALSEAGPISRPPADIQAILTVLGRRTLAFDVRALDLRETDLQGTILTEGNFQGALFFYANLRGAHLNGANLQRAGFIGADLRAAILAHSNLQGASLVMADLFKADLTRADLKGANLAMANVGPGQFGHAITDETTKFPEETVIEPDSQSSEPGG